VHCDASSQAVLALHGLIGQKEWPLILLDLDGDGFMSVTDRRNVYPDFANARFGQMGALTTSLEEWFASRAVHCRGALVPSV
jgi:hypothetical protein